MYSQPTSGHIFAGEAHIVGFYLTETGTYQQQVLRSFETHVGADDMNQLEQDTRGGRDININTLQNVAGNILKPQAQVSPTEAAVQIPNGWLCRRFRFMMVVEERASYATDRTTTRILFGYTDHSDASLNHLDPNMRIYFNSETVIQMVSRPTPQGMTQYPVVTSSNQILSPYTNTGEVVSLLHTPPERYLIRPEDVFHYQNASLIGKRMEYSIPGSNLQGMHDGRSMLAAGGGYKYSNRRTNSPTRFINEVLGAFNHGKKEAELDPFAEQSPEHLFADEVLYEKAAGGVANPEIYTSQFFAKLATRCGLVEQGFVRYQELVNNFPEVQQNVKYSLNEGTRSIRQMSEAQDSASWSGSDRTAVAGSLMTQVVPSIMMDCFLRQVTFAATNGSGRGHVIDIHPDGVRSIVRDLPMIEHLQEFQRRLVYDVLNVISQNNALWYQISASADLSGETIIDLAIEGEEPRRFVAPTFGDSLFAPIITHHQEQVETISSDLTFLAQQVFGGGVPHHSGVVVGGHAAVPASNDHWSQPVANSVQTESVPNHPYGDSAGSSHPYAVSNHPYKD